MNPLAIALQGIGFATVLVAVQGFVPVQAATIDTNPRYSTALNVKSQQLREEDEVLLSLLQLFVMEEA